MHQAHRPVKHKVFAYITHGYRLLVFRHADYPEAGIQVPAGTVELGEDPEAAVLREAAEETGLEDLILERFLGEEMRDMSGYGREEIVHRRFYHLRCSGAPPETWRHFECNPSEGGPGPIAFDFFWADLPHGVPPLAAGHDVMVPRMLVTLAMDGM